MAQSKRIDDVPLGARTSFSRFDSIPEDQATFRTERWGGRFVEPRRGTYIDGHIVEEKPENGDEKSDMPLTMPASKEQAGEDINRLGIEGVPGDAKSGPGMLRLEIFALVGLVLAVVVGVTAWLGWAAGLAMLGWGALAIIFNPVVWAAVLRIRDRKRAVKEERSQVVHWKDTDHGV